VCCSVMQCVAVCCSVLQRVAVCCSVLQCVAVCCSVMRCHAVWCSVLQHTLRAGPKNVHRPRSHCHPWFDLGNIATSHELARCSWYHNKLQCVVVCCTFQLTLIYTGSDTHATSHELAIRSWCQNVNQCRFSVYESVQHTATHCNTLQHSATHYNTLQHTAAHCNILQHTLKIDMRVRSESDLGLCITSGLCKENSAT